MKIIYMIGFYDKDLLSLIDHLEKTGYDKEEIERMKGAMRKEEGE